MMGNSETKRHFIVFCSYSVGDDPGRIIDGLMVFNTSEFPRQSDVRATILSEVLKRGRTTIVPSSIVVTGLTEVTEEDQKRWMEPADPKTERRLKRKRVAEKEEDDLPERKTKKRRNKE